jgi:hypothetical protein
MSTARRIPSISRAGALGIYDGQTRAGTVIRQGDEFFAFDAAGHCIGVFDSQLEAVRKIPRQREATS